MTKYYTHSDYGDRIDLNGNSLIEVVIDVLNRNEFGVVWIRNVGYVLYDRMGVVEDIKLNADFLDEAQYEAVNHLGYIIYKNVES